MSDSVTESILHRFWGSLERYRTEAERGRHSGMKIGHEG